VTDACIRSLQSGSPAAVSTPTKPDLYQERELKGGVHGD
jgi:hypothetical protein